MSPFGLQYSVFRSMRSWCRDLFEVERFESLVGCAGHATSCRRRERPAANITEQYVCGKMGTDIDMMETKCGGGDVVDTWWGYVSV